MKLFARSADFEKMYWPYMKHEFHIVFIKKFFHFHRYIFGGILDKQSKSIYHISIGDLVKCNTEGFFFWEGGGGL